MSLLLLFLMASLLVTGCVSIPIPREGRHVAARWKSQAADLQATAASRGQVIGEMGTPFWEFDDLRVIGYWWSSVEWGVFTAWAVTAGYGGDVGYRYDEPKTHRIIWLAFDEDDRLIHSWLTVRPGFETIWEQAARWRLRKKPPLSPAPPRQFAAVAPPPGQAVLHLFWAEGRTADHLQSVKVDGRQQAQIHRKRFTTLVLTPGSHEVKVLFPRPLSLNLTAGEVCFLEFNPDRPDEMPGEALFKCSELEALARLRKLTYCR